MLLIVDVETSGTDPKKDHLVEVAGVLFDPEAGLPVKSAAALVCSGGKGNAAAELNRIPPGMLLSGRGTLDVGGVPGWFEQFGAGHTPLAHNAAFDRQWLPFLEGDWICTYADAEWPRVPGGTGTLTAIALAYDVGVVRAHRAIEDCLTLAAVLTRVHELEGGLGAWLARAREPRRTIQALVSYDKRGLAKEAGFRWEPSRKAWLRDVRESVVDEFCSGLPFRVGGGA